MQKQKAMVGMHILFHPLQYSSEVNERTILCAVFNALFGVNGLLTRMTVLLVTHNRM